MVYIYEYLWLALIVDCVIFGLDESYQLKVLLIQCKNDLFVGCWALLGGFVDMDESLEVVALCELEEEIGVWDVFIEQFFIFGVLECDFWGWVVSVVYYVLVNLSEYFVEVVFDVWWVEWFLVQEFLLLVFDYDKILQMVINCLWAKVCYQFIGFELLFEQFIFFQLQ